MQGAITVVGTVGTTISESLFTSCTYCQTVVFLCPNMENADFVLPYGDQSKDLMLTYLWCTRFVHTRIVATEACGCAPQPRYSPASARFYLKR